jgi:hypothetical protein
MPIQTIEIGGYANDGTGDDLRTAFQKVNANFLLLDTEINVGGAANVGGGAAVFSQKNGAVLEFKTLVSSNNTIAFTTPSATTLNLESIARLQSDVTPSLGGNLNLAGFNIIDTSHTGDIQASIHGINIPIVNALLELLVLSSQLTVDMGTFLEPSGATGQAGNNGTTLELGGIEDPYSGNNLNFGTFI